MNTVISDGTFDNSVEMLLGAGIGLGPAARDVLRAELQAAEARGFAAGAEAMQMATARLYCPYCENKRPVLFSPQSGRAYHHIGDTDQPCKAHHIWKLNIPALRAAQEAEATV